MALREEHGTRCCDQSTAFTLRPPSPSYPAGIPQSTPFTLRPPSPSYPSGTPQSTPFTLRPLSPSYPAGIPQSTAFTLRPLSPSYPSGTPQSTPFTLRPLSPSYPAGIPQSTAFTLRPLSPSYPSGTPQTTTTLQHQEDRLSHHSPPWWSPGVLINALRRPSRTVNRLPSARGRGGRQSGVRIGGGGEIRGKSGVNPGYPVDNDQDGPPVGRLGTRRVQVILRPGGGWGGGAEVSCIYIYGPPSLYIEDVAPPLSESILDQGPITINTLIQ